MSAGWSLLRDLTGCARDYLLLALSTNLQCCLRSVLRCDAVLLSVRSDLLFALPVSHLWTHFDARLCPVQHRLWAGGRTIG